MHSVPIKQLTIIGGHRRNGEKEPVDEVTLEMDDVVSIVGPTCPQAGVLTGNSASDTHEPATLGTRLRALGGLVIGAASFVIATVCFMLLFVGRATKGEKTR